MPIRCGFCLRRVASVRFVSTSLPISVGWVQSSIPPHPFFSIDLLLHAFVDVDESPRTGRALELRRPLLPGAQGPRDSGSDFRGERYHAWHPSQNGDWLRVFEVPVPILGCPLI